MKSEKKYKALIAVLISSIILSVTATVLIVVYFNVPGFRDKLNPSEKIPEGTTIYPDSYSFTPNNILGIENRIREETEAETETLAYNQLLTYKPTESNVRAIGRTLYSDDTLWFSMSGSGVEFNCKGEYADITIGAYNARYLTSNHRPRVAVFVNNILTADEVLSEESQTIRVELSQYTEPVTVKVIKLSESMHSCVGIKEISVYGNTPVSPTVGNKIKMEFIGDSITCGYGLDEENSYAGFSTRTENFSETYAYLTSSAINAECYAVAYSGYGVLSGFTSNGVLRDEYIIKDEYEKSVYGMNFDYEDADRWSFDKYKPDIIVINLGTNDASYCSTYDRRERFIEEYQNLLTQVRTNNPQAFIVCVLGDMNNSLYPSIEEAVNNYSFESRDYRIRCTTINFDMGAYGSTIDGHPNRESNVLAAQTLVDYLRNNILTLY